MSGELETRYNELLSEAAPTASVLLYRRKGPDFYFLVSKRLVSPEIGRLSVPGGHIETGETPRAAVGRETLEEAGIYLGNRCLKPLVCSFQTFLGSARSYLLYCFVTAWDPEMGAPFNKEPNKHTNWRWISLSKLLRTWERGKLSLGLQVAVDQLVENSEGSKLSGDLVKGYRVLR